MHTAQAEIDAVAEQERAARLAIGAAAHGADAAASQRQFLVFALGAEAYAAPIDAVREILEVPALTRVPLMPRFVRGVINLRGAVVPVLDLASRLELASTPIGRRTCVVVVEVEAGEDGDASAASSGARPQVLGVLVDTVHEVIDIAPTQIEPAPAVGARIDPQFIAGMAKVGGRFLVVLDLGRALAQRELARLIVGDDAR
ncbi:MAG TPA: chemotaxis protein CheW [Burkholderiaceae bacterium]|nr:chemotaxis protein CheW [Burkholderiaceae bacterium]